MKAVKEKWKKPNRTLQKCKSSVTAEAVKVHAQNANRPPGV